jgi:aminoglycoside 2''-phosphotransferase
MEINFQKYIHVIQNHYPDVRESSLKLFDDGHDHYVFLLSNGVAFRFPRGEEYGKKDAIITAFLHEFAKQSSLPIQEFESHTDEKVGAYQTYYFIQGTKFLPNVARTFRQDEKLQIARQIGKFLKTLHEYPIPRAEEMGAYKIDVKGYYDYFASIWPKDREIIYPMLREEEKQYLDKIFSEYMETKEAAFTPVVTHDDVLPEHIIVDEKQHKMSGIIDFSLRIADPARDFMFLHVFGNDFLGEALAEYGKVEDLFMKRRAFYGANFYVMYLYNAVTGENSKEKVEKYKKALSSYLAGNYTLS